MCSYWSRCRKPCLKDNYEHENDQESKPARRTNEHDLLMDSSNHIQSKRAGHLMEKKSEWIPIEIIVHYSYCAIRAICGVKRSIRYLKINLR